MFSVLYSFAGYPDGANPEAGLVMDTAGNLYGTTNSGGSFLFGPFPFLGPFPYDGGTVFKVDPSGSETVLHSFAPNGGDGAIPYAGLVMDTAGNLYGTTESGGSSGNGTVFKVDPSGSETVLYSFTDSGGDGALPFGGVVIDKAGNLYGTTEIGGSSGDGTVFKVDPSGGETVLYSFANSGGANSGGDGANPVAGLVMDTAGNLYGTTEFGGSSDSGTVFKVDPSGSETVLYSFTNSGGDGAYPFAGLLMDTAGNLYGTTTQGGSSNNGTVFKVDSSGSETVLYSFTNSGGDGQSPEAGLIMDAAGNLYGTAHGGGSFGNGIVFKVDPSGSETVLHGFTGSGGDGADPEAGLIMDKAGNLYGTTAFGGSSDNGTVFKLTVPTPTPSPTPTPTRTPTPLPSPTPTPMPPTPTPIPPTPTPIPTPTPVVRALHFGPNPVSLPNTVLGVTGATSAPVQVHLKDPSGSPALPITLEGMEFVGPNSGDFAIQSSTCPPVMTPGLVCFLNLTFTPTGLGLRTARLKIFDNASNRPQVFHLSGYGVRGRLPRSPTGLVFGAVANGSSKALSIRLTNPETVALSITSIAIKGLNAPEFGEIDNCVGILGAGNSCTITVTFTPTAVGRQYGKVKIFDAARRSPQIVPAQGWGTR